MASTSATSSITSASTQAPVSLSEQPQHVNTTTSSNPVLSMAPAVFTSLSEQSPSSSLSSSAVHHHASSSSVSLPTSLSAHRLFNMPAPFLWTSTSTQPVPMTSPAPFSGTRTILDHQLSPPPVFSAPTFSGQPEIGILPQQSSLPLSGSASQPSSLASMAAQLGFSTLNVPNIVTTRLSAVEDYLPWRTQFESFLVSHSLFGILDGSISAPPQFTCDAIRREIPNPEYTYWLKIDQTVRSWLFATLSRDILMAVYHLQFSACIWEALETHFMNACRARSIELKRQISHIKKKETQTIDQYLLEIKLIVDALNMIKSPVSNRDVLEYTIIGLGPEYESLLTILDYLPGDLTLEKLGPILTAQERRNIYLRSQENVASHQAFAAVPQRGGAARGQAGRHPGGRGRGGQRGRGHRGRGRGYGGQPHAAYGGGQQAYGGQQMHGGQQPPLLPLPAHGQQYSGQHVFGGMQPRGQQQQGVPGFPSVDNNYSHASPPVVCQICYSPGHSALTCPRFVGSSTPALAVLPTGETNASVWYPDSGASAHMTPHEGQSDGGASSSGLQ
ncbi:unnamed protein product [Cuscuta epithymum]|uniref:Retrotransposon gag domain-containing protein n=2 Tax=Cuscuta epithymum TaxID=186058 RepID=A0AAV0DPE0_9ASTE|nr:unnamed protein product [Cuscuta epithymum]